MNPITISNGMINYFKCNKCMDYLTPPMNHCLQGHNLCNKCSENVNNCPKCNDKFMTALNKSFGQIANNLLFPCRFVTKGCDKRFKWNELSKHNIECQFRQYNCPMCPWTGSIDHLKPHFVNDHYHLSFWANDRTVEFYLHLTKPYRSFLIITPKQDFLMTLMRQLESKCTEITLQLLGTKKEANKYYFEVLLENTTYTFKCPVVSLNHDAMCTTSKIVISDFQVSDICSAKSSVLLILQINEYSPTSDVKDTIFNEIECPVCTEYMVAPIYQCPIGHSVCNKCKSKLTVCSMCSKTLADIRNFTLESVVSKLVKCCKFGKDGCRKIGKIEEINEHELVCRFGNFTCVECSWKGGKNDIIPHVQKEHKLLPNCNNPGVSLYMDNVLSAVIKKRTLEFDGKPFREYAITDLQTGMLNFVVQSYDTEPGKYFYVIKIKDNVRMVTYSEICTSHTVSHEKVIADGKAISIPLSKIRTFVDTDGMLKFYLIVSKQQICTKQYE